MKRLLLSLFLISGITYGQGDPAPYIKGQAATGLGNQASTVFVPNQQSTKINAYQARIETGNGNLLSNPSFEAGTYNSGWTCSLGSTTLETTAKTDGNKANAINSIGAGVRCYQTSTTNAANLKGLLGSAILKVKTTDSIYKVCGLVDGNAAANERNCITVKPTSADLPFYPARTDFYMGGTSNGIVVYTTTTTSQPTVIDDAFVGVFNGGLSQFSNSYSRRPYTPTFTGFGTVTNIDCYESREGQYNVIDCSATVGTPTATEARVSLPSTNVTSAIGSSLYICGDAGKSQFSAADFRLQTLCEPSKSYITFGSQTNGTSSIVKANGNGTISPSSNFKFTARIPIAGWEANTNAAISGCVDAFGCTNEFTAKISITDVVTDQNIPFINGNCTNGTAGRGTCNYVSNSFTATPNCTLTTTGSTPPQVIIISQSNTSITYETQNSAGTATDGAVNISCQKTGTDFKPKTVVVSPLQGYVKVPGAENQQIDIFKVSYGATATSNCTTGTCAYIDVFGLSNPGFSVSVSGTTYTLTTPKTYIKLKCEINGSDAFAAKVTGIINGANNNTFTFNTAPGAGILANSWATISCMGTY